MDSPSSPTLFQRLTRLFALGTNLLLILSGASLLFCIAMVYCIPASFDLIQSIQNLINAHAFMSFTGLLCLAMIVLGSIGLHFLRADLKLFLGLQVFALLFILVLEAALFYTTLSLWINHIELGVIFAVQLFQPSTSEKPTMAGIQVALHCCGRGSFEDYYIANEAIVKGYVPHSCCDSSRYNSTVCREVARLPAKRSITSVPNQAPESHRHAWLVPSQYSFPRGCNQRIRSVLVLSALVILSFIAGTIVLAVCVESFYLHLTHKDDSKEDPPMNGRGNQIFRQSSDQLLQVPEFS